MVLRINNTLIEGSNGNDQEADQSEFHRGKSNFIAGGSDSGLTETMSTR